MITMSGSVRRKATTDFRCRKLRSVVRPLALPSFTRARVLHAHEAFELRGSPADHLIDGLAALRVFRDHLGGDRLAVDLHGDLRRRRISRDRWDLAFPRRI